MSSNTQCHTVHCIVDLINILKHIEPVKIWWQKDEEESDHNHYNKSISHIIVVFCVAL